MIDNARALETQYVPEDLQHRDGQIEQLASALRPIASGLSGEHSMIFGPSGSGKTTLAKYVVRMLREEAFGVRRAYWNCMGGSSKTDVLHGLVQSAGIGRHLPNDGVSSSRYIDQFRETDDHIVAIIDEVDELEDETTILALSDLPNMTLVLVTINEDHLFSDPQFDGRFKSRFSSGEKLRLSLFSDQQIEDILWYRIQHGLKAGVIGDETVSYISTRSHGNARNAINLLRRATREAVAESRSSITTQDVRSVQDGAAEDSRRELIDALGTHKRLLYDLILEAGEIGASELSAAYKCQARDPRKKSSRNRYLRDLERKYGLIESEGSTRAKVYRATDR